MIMVTSVLLLVLMWDCMYTYNISELYIIYIMYIIIIIVDY